MKLKKILKWSIISLVFELGFLYYINNYFLVDSTFIKAEKVFGDTKLPHTIEITVPYGAKEIKISYDGEYISYIENGKLYIVSTKTYKVVKQIKMEEKNTDYYTWLPDRNRILYFLRERHGHGIRINLEAYDVDNSLNNTVNKAIYLPDKSFVSYMTLSPFTNMIYIKVDTPLEDRLYQVNIMSEIRRMYLPVKKILKMAEIQKKDNLIYQSSNNIIHVIRDGKKDTYLSTKKYVLIGIDGNDNVYIGSLNNKKQVINLYYGTVDKPLSLWSKITLRKAENPQNIIIIPKDGNLGVIQNNKLKNLKNGIVVKGYGKIIDINKNYIVYQNKDKIILKAY
ncbi:hypothetical protein [Thermoanaerobacter uzonensis]|uniref:hypothetical protein n=1 Tax=Thermoanaerobacter uzonensis TaxID=447593 RepID=UPI003D76A1F4